MALVFAVVFTPLLFSQEETATTGAPGRPAGEQRLDTLRYGTETEIAALIQSLRSEGTDQLDGELSALAGTTRNRSILTGIFSFFNERGKEGLEDRAIRAVEERDDEAPETVLAAMDYLGKRKHTAAADALQGIIAGEERRFMGAAFKALGQVGSADPRSGATAAEYLTDFYSRGNPADDQRREIIIAIGETRSSRGVPFLAEIARNQDERMVLRIAALEALAKIGDPEGLPAILLAVPATDPNVRSAAVGALGPFSGPEVDNAVFEAFRDSFWRTRLAAASAARERKLKAAIPYLRYRAENDETPQVKDEAIRALGAIGGGEALGILSSLFSERKNADRVRILAGEMLIQNDPGRYAPALIAEIDEAKKKNQTPLYNGLLKNIGGAKTPAVENFTRLLLTSGGVIEKSYGLDMAANNEFRSLAAEVRTLTDEKAAGGNPSLARKARLTLQKLGLSE